jgi:protein-S-isoprenylcysteine O-methyltransferase Ste14
MDETSTTSSSAPGPSSGGSATGSINTNYRAPAPNGLPIPPPLLALLLLAGGLLLHAMSHGPRMVFAHHVLGLLIVAGGTGLCFYAAAVFQARGTTKNPHGDATAFVVEMPYTFTRNPMYLGITLVLFGFAVFFSSIAMLLAPLAFVVIIDRMMIPLEEQNMERLFGPSYMDYQTRVRRWL